MDFWSVQNINPLSAQCMLGQTELVTEEDPALSEYSW